MLIAPRCLSPRRRFLCMWKTRTKVKSKTMQLTYGNFCVQSWRSDHREIRTFSMEIAHETASYNNRYAIVLNVKAICEIRTKIWLRWSVLRIPGEEFAYQAIMLLLNTDEWQICRCLIVFRSPKLGSENNGFLNEPIKISFGKICQSVLTWVRCNIPKGKELKGAIICKFHVRNHEVCDRNAKLATGFALSAFYSAWNAPVICSRNLIVFVLFIWFSQVFAYGPVTVFSNAWLSSKRLSDFWKGKIHTDRRVPRNGSHHEAR